MGTVVERIRTLCKEKGIAVSKLESELGYGNGYLNPKKIQTVTTDRAAEIAQYLGVSVEYLLTEETKEAPSNSDEATEDTIKAAFWGGEKELTQNEIDELWEDAKSYIAFKTEQAKKRRK